MPQRAIALRSHWVSRALALHLAVYAGCALAAAWLLWPVTGGDFPPGVDTPTFLHLSWVTELALTGKLANPLVDPYWYGGFFYLIYPPLAYGLVGALAAFTPLSLVPAYNLCLMLAYGGLGYSVWVLARELGLSGWLAGFAAALAALAYPVVASVFLWGWFTTILALPPTILALAALERAARRDAWRWAAAAGALLALATLLHHMTSLALVFGLVPWFGWRFWQEKQGRRALVKQCLIAGGVTALLIAPWAIPFLREAGDAGFRREIPGNWQPPLSEFRRYLLNPSIIGKHYYPGYLGIVLTALALAGALIALVERQRLGAIALLALVLLWISLGANGNPLIYYYPFSGLDVARFQLYLAPFMALLAALAAQRLLAALRATWWDASLPEIAWRGVVVGVAVLLLAHPVYEAALARRLAQPYRVAPDVRQALDWLAAAPPDGEGNQPTVYGVGFWNWQAFLVPYAAGLPLLDGWHDEGAAHVREIRELRRMAWIGGLPLDAARAHEIFTELGADYVVIHRSYWRGERGQEWADALARQPDLFQIAGQWDEVALFRVAP